VDQYLLQSPARAKQIFRQEAKIMYEMGFKKQSWKNYKFYTKVNAFW
jgi:hypothetical protein